MSYIKPEDVPRDKERKVLDFLNAAKTSEEIAATIEFPGERDVGIKIAQRILKERDILGGFTSLKQIDDIKQIGPERFAEIVKALGSEKVEKEKVERSKKDKYRERSEEEATLRKQLIREEIKDWMNKLPSEKRDEPYLVVGHETFTPKQLVEEVEKDTEIGKMVGRTLDKGRLELSRRKR